MADDLKPGDVIEVHEVYLQGPMDGPCVYVDEWCAATIMALNDYRVDVILQAGERKGMMLALTRFLCGKTWRRKVPPC
jgi:hypothetical protein